jgi:hypothetical protein
MMHTPPANVAEVRAVLELFPKCSVCGQPLSIGESVVPDPARVFRLCHRACPACSPAPLPAA